MLDPQADSIGIPIIGSVYLTLILSPVVLGVTSLCLRRYNPEARLASWRRDRPCRSALATLVLGAPAALVMVALTWDSLPGQPWQEYLWPAYATLLLAWLLGLRAAAIEQLGRNE